jgi:hypothetical protein
MHVFLSAFPKPMDGTIKSQVNEAVWKGAHSADAETLMDRMQNERAG